MNRRFRGMPSRSIIAALTLGSIACGPVVRPSPGAPVQEEERASVIATAQALFDGMRTRDTARLRRLVAPGLVLVSVRDSAGHDIVRYQAVEQFLRSIASAREELRERMWDPVVLIDGGIATLWAPYDFYIGDRFSHCGYDSFQLARVDGTWVITGLLYTVRSERCPA